LAANPKTERICLGGRVRKFGGFSNARAERNCGLEAGVPRRLREQKQPKGHKKKGGEGSIGCRKSSKGKWAPETTGGARKACPT